MSKSSIKHDSKIKYHFKLGFTPEFIENYDIKPIIGTTCTGTITLSSSKPMTKIEAYIYARYLISKTYEYNKDDPRAASFGTDEDTNLRIVKTTFNDEAVIILTHLPKSQWLVTQIIDVDEIFPIGYLRGYAHRKGRNATDKEYSRAIGYDIDFGLPSIPKMKSDSPDDDTRAIYELDMVTGNLNLEGEKDIPNLILKYQPLVHGLWRKMKADDVAENFKTGHSYGVYPSNVGYYCGSVNGEKVENICESSAKIIDQWLETNLEMNC